MTDPRRAPELSPAARELVEKSAAVFKDSIIELAHKSQLSQPNPKAEVTEVDVRFALDQLGIAMSEASAGKQVRLKRSTYRTVSYYGLIISGTLLVVLLVIYAVGIDYTEKVVNVVAIFLAAMGLAYSGYATYSTRLRKPVEVDVPPSVSEYIAEHASREVAIIRGWAALEQAMQEAFGDLAGSAPRNLSKLIHDYADKAQLTRVEEQEVRSILALRNQLAHSPIGYTADFDLKYYEALIRRHLDKIRSMRPG